MSFGLLITVITFVVLLIASYIDIKTREVPDWLSYGFIFTAAIIKLIFSFELGTEILIEGALGFITFFILSVILYYSHQWGGGDSKLLMGMGIALGIPLPFSEASFTLLWFFLLLFLTGTVWGLLWMVGVAVTKKSTFLPAWKKQLKKHRSFQYVIWIITLLFAILTYFHPLLWPFMIIPAFFYYLVEFVLVIEHNCFTQKTSIKNLTEGDWVAEPVKYKGKRLLARKTLQKDDIQLLRKKKIRSIIIKEGVPFVPGFLFSYILIIMYPNMTQILFGLIM